jgi:gliding motility-associated-like protein
MHHKLQVLLLKVSGVCLMLLAGLIPAYAQNCQTITVQMVNTVPSGSGGDGNPIKICQNTTVSFTASATFSQSSAGAIYIWSYGDGSLLDTTTATTTHTYTTGGVYIVDLLVVDPQNCKNNNRLNQVVQVSTTPLFTGTGAADDTICLHSTVVIHGEAHAVPGIYDCAPPVSDTTFLPDGTGVSYETSIEVECFAPGATLTDTSQLESICLNMEHSYLGDLEMKIICPNNQTTILKQFPGSGGTYLGEPFDTGTPNDMSPGPGYTYCFAPDAVWGTMVQEDGLGNHVVGVGVPAGNSMSPGTYKSFQTFTNLIGCPLNGTWTIEVTDWQGVDNGFIFNWGINFDPTLLPGSYSFLPNFVNEGWLANPDILATSNGGHDITVKPTSGGQKCYTYRVTDNFGCSYDTTVCIYVVDPGNPGQDTSFKLCLNQGGINVFDYLGGNPTLGGTWSGPGVTTGGIFDPAAVGVGTYEIMYKQSRLDCDTKSVATIRVVNDVIIDFDFVIGPGCTEDTVHFTNLSDTGRYWWNFGDGTFPDDTLKNPTHIYQQQDQYPVRLTVQNIDGCIDSVIKLVDVRHPLIAEFTQSADSVCQTDGAVLFTDASTGNRVGWQWDFGDGGTSTLQNPSHTYTLAGTHQIRLVINDNIPCTDTVYHNVYVDSLPFLNLFIDRHAICEGEAVNLSLDYLKPSVSVNWDFGDGNHWEQFDGTKHSFDQAGTYRITATGNYPVCASVSASDSVVVSAFPVVNLGPDSVICLDGPSITLSDLNNGSNPAVKWLWNTGDTSSSIVVVHPGTYSVTASENNCATTDNVIVNKDCYTDIPNAFTPNGDGSNDYFFPRQLLSKGVAGFTMSVYNRWGQKLFETDNPNGRGWDGKFNEKEQPMGVYIYQMKVVLKNGKIEEYEGNVTLVR